MFESQVAREAPLSFSAATNPTHPSVPNEEVLAVDNIQGNLVGFNKDHQTMIFLEITSIKHFRRWLKDFVPFVATAHEVLLFNRLFKEIRTRRKVETRTVQATWINLAFSFKALHQLTKNVDSLQQHALHFPAYQAAAAGDPAALSADAFADAAFKEGMAKRAVAILQDPENESAEGNPRNWVFGGTGNEPDAVIIVASDSAKGLEDEVGRIEESIYSGRTTDGKPALSGARIVYKQRGATLPPPLTGHEHFGFLDGVSQPGLRGRISDDPTDVLTPRQNPLEPLNQGKPGQDVLFPGEFIFGYHKQDPTDKDIPGKVAEDAPVWAKDGSFLVVRRLRQEVGAFHKFLKDQAPSFSMSAEKLGAKLVGRWASGAPVMREPDQDNPPLGNNDCANNHFEFQSNAAPIPPTPGTNDYCVDNNVFPQAVADPDGLRCPFAGHIRKTYPRDDTAASDPTINENTTQTHRLLRRGIPFGDPYFPPVDPAEPHDSGNRGLLFAAYQTSIVNQFEFVQSAWVNNAEFKDETDENGQLQSGHDFLIGQNNTDDGKRTRKFILPVTENGTKKLETITTEDDWVIPTGGGYFFQPSIDALCLLSGAKCD